MSSTSSSPTPPKGGVRSMISIFENQTYTVNNESTSLVRRTKSMVNLSYTRPIKITTERIEPEKNLELVQIEQQIHHLQNKLSNNYKTYSRENHIYYQNQIIFILTDLANVETRNSAASIDKKSELTEILKRLNKKLNVVLPSEGGEVLPQTPTPTPRYDKFGVRSRSIDGEKLIEVKTNKKEPVEVKVVTKEAVVKKVKKQKSEEIDIVYQVEERERERERERQDEIDSAAVSVRSLKEIFEKNTNENEGKAEFGMVKISRKYTTFNSNSDLKYVPYSEKFKSQEVNGRESPLEKQNSLDSESSTEYSPTTWKVIPASDDETGGEIQGDVPPETLTNDDSDSSSSDSDSEKTAKEELEDE